MKADQRYTDQKSYEGKLDEFWYKMGWNTYSGEGPSCEIPDKSNRLQLESFRKGILDAASSLGDLEREDFYSEQNFKGSEINASSRRK